MPSPRPADHLQRLERELHATERGLQHDLDQLAASATPSAWLGRNLRQGLDQGLSWARRWGSRLLAEPNYLLVLGGVVAGAVLIGWALTGRDDDDERPATGLIVRRARSSFFGRLLSTALQTFVLFYARKLLMEYLNKDAPAKASASTPAPSAEAPKRGPNPAGPPPADLAATPFSQTP